MTTQSLTTTQVYRVYIRATPEAIWDAITKPEWTDRYGYGGIPEFDLRPGQPYVVHPGAGMKEFPNIPDDIIDGEILEADPPRRLSMTWRMLMDETMMSEGFTRLTYEIDPIEGAAHEADRHPRARGRADARRDGRRARRRPRAPAAAGRGRCPTSSRCSRRASGSPTRPPPHGEGLAPAGPSRAA